MRKLTKKAVKTEAMVQLYASEGKNTNWYCQKGNDGSCTNYVCHN